MTAIPKGLETLIAKLNESAWKGHFIEIGAGMGLSDSIFRNNGASKTILSAYSPYSKEELSDYTGRNFERSVSEEVVSHIIRSRCLKDNEFIFANSFQIGKRKCNHGWIGISYRLGGKIYTWTCHITLSIFAISRDYVITKIGNIGLRLLCMKLFGVKSPELNANIDITPYDNYEVLDHLVDLENYNDKSGLAIFNPEGETIRLEELRNTKKLTIYKGSFNPPHGAHKFIYDEMSKITNKVVLAISINTFGKEKITRQEIERRIDLIHELMPNAYVLVNYEAEFRYLIPAVSFRLPTVEIHAAMGVDTYERVEDNLFRVCADISFDVFERGEKKGGECRPKPLNVKLHASPEETKNLSSTEIRNAQK